MSESRVSTGRASKKSVRTSKARITDEHAAETNKLEHSSKSGRFEDGQFVRHKGISWLMCALYLVGNMAGGGIVAMPRAMKNLYLYPGIFVCLLVCFICLFTSVLLGRCWKMLLQRYPEYRTHCRQVYGEIGYRSMGKWMKIIVLITIDLNQFGICIVYLLLSAKSIHDFVSVVTDNYNISFDHCMIVPILAIPILPITFLKSPHDFGWTIFIAMACSVLSVMFIKVGAFMDYNLCTNNGALTGVVPHTPSVVSSLSALGTFVFAFGGHSSFPTIQHDMKKPFEFERSSYLAFGLIVLVYAPMSIVSNLVYGNAITTSIINSIQTVWIQQAINLMIMFHCLMAFFLILNPLNQQIEEIFRAPQNFSWKRVLIRTFVLSLIVFMALTLPTFGPLLDFLGSSLTLLTVMIYPGESTI